MENSYKELKQASQITIRLFEAGVDIVDLSAGIYDINKRLIYPSISDGHACYLNYALIIRRETAAYSGIISFAGNIYDLQAVEEKIEDNMGVSIARSLIVDPQFINNFIYKGIRNSSKCLRDESCPCHYFSLSKDGIDCCLNRCLGNEVNSRDI